MHILQGHAAKSWAIAVKLKVPIMHESFKPINTNQQLPKPGDLAEHLYQTLLPVNYIRKVVRFTKLLKI